MYRKVMINHTEEWGLGYPNDFSEEAYGLPGSLLVKPMLGIAYAWHRLCLASHHQIDWAANKKMSEKTDAQLFTVLT